VITLPWFRHGGESAGSEHCADGSPCVHARATGQCPADRRARLARSGSVHDVTLRVAAADLPWKDRKELAATTRPPQRSRRDGTPRGPRRPGCRRCEEAGGFDTARRLLAHRFEPPLYQRLPARPQLGHRSVYVGEHVVFPVGVVFLQGRLLPPEVAGVASERVEQPQERRGVGQGEGHRAPSRAHRPIIECQCLLVLPEFAVEQRLGSTDMELVHVVEGGS
jgi:hypothetical protein